MIDIEKLGVFYLGREFDRATGKATEAPILYDARDLTTHAVCVGNRSLNRPAASAAQRGRI